MNRLPRRHELLAVTLVLVGLPGFAWPIAAGPPPPLVLERKIPLGEVQGRIDHLAIDLARDRLFVAELGNDSLGVVDLAASKILRRIGGLSEPQGVAYDPATGLRRRRRRWIGSSICGRRAHPARADPARRRRRQRPPRP